MAQVSQFELDGLAFLEMGVELWHCWGRRIVMGHEFSSPSKGEEMVVLRRELLIS